MVSESTARPRIATARRRTSRVTPVTATATTASHAQRLIAEIVRFKRLHAERCALARPLKRAAGHVDDSPMARPSTAEPEATTRRSEQPNRLSPVQSRAIFVLAALGGLAVRAAFTFQKLRSTMDLNRGVVTGRAVWEHGPAAAGRPLIETFPWAHVYHGIPWSQMPYNYPPVSVGFFTFVAALGGGTILAKALLGVSDAACAWLIGRLTGRRIYGLLFWLSPVTMWWTSHEGQFETLQSLLGLSALATVQWPLTCGVLIALAVQTKMTAAALLPFFLWTMFRRRRLTRFVAGGVLGTLPTAALSLLYPLIPNIFRYSVQLSWNPYYWNPTDPHHNWSADWILGRVLPQILIALLVGWLGYLAWRKRLLPAASAAIGYAVFMKFYTQIPPWYLASLPILLVPLALIDRFRYPRSNNTADTTPTSAAVSGRATRVTGTTAAIAVPLAFTAVWSLVLFAETETILRLQEAMLR